MQWQVCCPGTFHLHHFKVLRRLFTQAAAVLREHRTLYASGGSRFLFAFSGSVVYDFHPPAKTEFPDRTITPEIRQSYSVPISEGV